MERITLIIALVAGISAGATTPIEQIPVNSTYGQIMVRRALKVMNDLLNSSLHPVDSFRSDVHYFYETGDRTTPINIRIELNDMREKLIAGDMNFALSYKQSEQQMKGIDSTQSWSRELELDIRALKFCVAHK